MTEARFDLIGIDAAHLGGHPAEAREPAEVRIRVAGRTETLAEAVRVGNEVESLYTNGPSGGGGCFKQAIPIIAVASTLIARDLVRASVQFEEA